MLKYLVMALMPSRPADCVYGAIFLVATRHPDYAMALLIWAVMLDHIDGWLARRLKRRPRNYALVGEDMDSATDMVSAAIVPGLIGIQLSGGTVLSLIAALLIAVAACLRVGYFNNFGLTDAGRFYGVPLTYTVPMTGLCLGAGKLVNSLPASLTLPWVLIVMAVLHVCPFGPPPVRGIGFLLVFDLFTRVL
ncbi:MAG: hypothetical protein CBARDMAM_5152 [uncultured Caballeronia sp.]|nr:MAG: hypothetical protein CBARDMAM_5152 [uncultured Caballeronia sp.]